MLPSDYTKEMWDKEFACRFTVELGADELKTNMSVKNTGSEDSFDFQAALHSYFTVSSLENLEITGSFEGKEFLNKMVGLRFSAQYQIINLFFTSQQNVLVRIYTMKMYNSNKMAAFSKGKKNKKTCIRT